MLCCNTLTCNGCDSVLGEEGCVCVCVHSGFFPADVGIKPQCSGLKNKSLSYWIRRSLKKKKKSVISFAFIKSTLNKRTVATFFSFQLE